MAVKVIFVLSLVLCGCFADELPSFIHVCHVDDPNVIPCMLAAIEDVRPFLVDGVPEYNIPSLEPLIMKDFFSENVAGMKVTVFNVSAWGCTDFFARKIEADIDNHDFVIFVDIPKLRIEAHYNVDGKILMVPVKGDGNLETNITEINAIATLNGSLVVRDGQEYLTFTKMDLQVNVGGGQVRLENLFNGDKVLLGMINDVVNKNLDVFLKELMPVIEKALSSVFLSTSNAIVSSFTYQQLFLH